MLQGLLVRMSNLLLLFLLTGMWIILMRPPFPAHRFLPDHLSPATVPCRLLTEGEVILMRLHIPMFYKPAAPVRLEFPLRAQMSVAEACPLAPLASVLLQVHLPREVSNLPVIAEEILAADSKWMMTVIQPLFLPARRTYLCV